MGAACGPRGNLPGIAVGAGVGYSERERLRMRNKAVAEVGSSQADEPCF